MISLLAAAVLSLSQSAVPLAPKEDWNGVPRDLLSKFTTGANVTRWFCYVPANGQAAHFTNYLIDADFDEFRKLGIKFVRLCISPDIIYYGGKPTDKLAAIDTALDKLYSHNIAVIWDLHDNGQLGLDKPEKDNSGLITFWNAVTAHYKGTHYSDMVFEVVNEPVFIKNPDDWYSLQGKVVSEIRKVDSRRTVMVSPTYWSSIDTLQKMAPLPEKNLIYTVHCYDPFNFTHQGAEWIDEIPKNLVAVPFPGSPEAIKEILPKNDPKYTSTLEDYGTKHYDDAYLLSRLTLARDWGHVHHVPILLGEFGSYPKVSQSDSRARWFAGMKAAISSLKLPNAIWGYDEGLGIGRNLNQDGSLSFDSVTLSNFYSVQTAQAKVESTASASSTPTAAASEATSRVVVWDGEKHDQGSSWVNPTTSTFLREKEDAHSGDTALALKFDDKQNWIGFGFDWFEWKAGSTIGTDTSKMTTLNFWVKATGLNEDLQIQLLCNGDVIDTPEHHAPKMSVAKYCPNFRDGKWHEVVIPLKDMDYPKGYDPKVVTMIDFGFYTQEQARGSILIDDIAFDNRSVK